MGGVPRQLAATSPKPHFNSCTDQDMPLPRLEGRAIHECSTCTICLGDFEPGEQLRILPCALEAARDVRDPPSRERELESRKWLCQVALLASKQRRALLKRSAPGATRAAPFQRPEAPCKPGPFE